MKKRPAKAHRPHTTRVYRGGETSERQRELPEEMPVALSFNGTTQAVMMATPADLEDFGRGFALTEGIATPDEIEDLQVLVGAAGIDVQMWLGTEAEARLAARRRHMAGPVGCGLCGLDSIEAVLRDVAQVTAALSLTPAQVTAAMAALPGHQSLHDVTRAAHGAGFFIPGRGMVLAREDVGRHNALDKLAGALLAGGVDTGMGAVVLTCRVSIDMVQKCAALGAPVMIAVSAPTAHAVRLAEALGLTLIGLARGDGFEVFTHPDRIRPERNADVA
ncbi:formate dehydrogenase accessory sulfurtransferase FdhD [Acidimangrovimonas sediminis]|uniref:formate dehydrogenase accessory sulfurtransferase FdhD n=1 Tax=Acidimangrovimonas sediminis TaxID=2056283 RepID=UPI000C8025C4|nr:formate dehydrogenase accessory sulfurtransferase FdhD [Acidimangrovimonas sediminis]